MNMDQTEMGRPPHVWSPETDKGLGGVILLEELWDGRDYWDGRSHLIEGNLG